MSTLLPTPIAMATATAIPSTPPSLSTTTTKGKMHYNKKSIGDEKIHKGVFDMIRLYGLIIISSCLVIQDYLLLVVKHKNWILNKQERTNFTNTIKNTIRRYVLSVIYTISSNIIHIFVIIPFNIWYYIIITIPYLIIYNIYLFFIKLIKVLCRKSSTLCILVSRVTALLDVIISIHKKICSSNIIELVSLGVEGIQEIISAFFTATQETVHETATKKVSSTNGLSELVYYEETVDEDESVVPMQYRRSMHAMHNFVPSNPFRATIRIHPSMNDNSTINTNNALVTGNVDQDALELVEQISRECVACSPVSFPTTPFSRAHVMNQSSEKVEMLIFAARDLLRLEAQSTSRDEYSRNAAKEAQQNGQFAVFDPRQASNGIVLGCGYHCASKIGNGLCSCCRSMMPIRPKTYVYVEFSITVSGNQVPSLGVGLAPPDCPLNVMVGSWSRSLGVYADGQILIGSRWFQSLSSAKLSAGSTVGMLVHYEDIDDSVGSNNTQEGSTIKDCNGVFTCSVNINGKHINYSPETYAAMQDITSLGPQLYPTVSLFSEGTRVWCRFCEADIVYRSRDSIGAPKGAKIYCLDGSLLLSEEDK